MAKKGTSLNPQAVIVRRILNCCLSSQIADHRRAPRLDGADGLLQNPHTTANTQTIEHAEI